MLRVALKGILARKLRLVSTSFAVLLGVAFMAGTFVFTDTIQKAFDDLFADVFENTDSWVRSAESVEAPFGGDIHPRIPGDTVELVDAVDGVADAQGYLQAFAQVVGNDGDPVGDPNMAPTFGQSWLTGELNSWNLTEGSREPGPNELVVDKHTADEGDLELGDTVSVITTTGTHGFPLVGIARFGDADSPGGASFALLDLATAQEVLLLSADTDQVDAVAVVADDGVGEEEITARIQAALPADLEALTGKEITDENTDAIERGLSFLTIFLSAFAGIALFVGMFVIYNTFAITIAQRVRETALLRAIGASRKQVLGSMMLEALVIGVIASLLGLVGGVALAFGLHELLDAFGVEIPSAGTVVQSRTVIVSVIVGTLVTLVSGVMPAVRGSRVPPVAAMRDVAIESTEGSRARGVIGAVITALGVFLTIAGLSGEIGLLALGAPLLFIGAFVLAPLIARPVARLIGAPIAAARGIAGTLARENARRNPKRTARTAAALMVGVALVAGTTILASSVKQSIRDVLEEQFVGDLALDSGSVGFGGLSPELAHDVAALPDVEVATGVRVALGKVTDVAGADEEDAIITVVDPVPASELFDIGVVEGSLAELRDDGIFLHDDKADDLEVGVGDTVPVQLIDGTVRPLTVQGIYTENALAGSYVITQGLSEASGADQFDFTVYVRLADGVSLAEGKAALQPIVDQYPNAEMLDREQYVDDQAETIDGFVNFIYGMLAFAVIIALFGIANTLLLSVYERTRELGLLRAVGMTRGQLRSTVRWESVIISLLGVLMGLVIAVFLAFSFVKALEDEGIETFKFPVVGVVVILVLAMVFAILAALWPAWRASKLDILRAIAHD